MYKYDKCLPGVRKAGLMASLKFMFVSMQPAIIPTTKPIVRVILKIISFNVLHTLYVYNYADKNILHLPICRGIPSTETHRIGTTF